MDIRSIACMHGKYTSCVMYNKMTTDKNNYWLYRVMLYAICISRSSMFSTHWCECTVSPIGWSFSERPMAAKSSVLARENWKNTKKSWKEAQFFLNTLYIGFFFVEIKLFLWWLLKSFSESWIYENIWMKRSFRNGRLLLISKK